MKANRLVRVAPFVPLRSLYTYRFNKEDIDRIIGCRVVVPFGRRQVVGLVLQDISTETQPPEREVREIVEVLDEHPVVSAEAIDLLLWTARYYYAAPGDVVRMALPSALHGRLRKSYRLTSRGKEILNAQNQVLRRSDEALTRNEEHVLRWVSLRRGGRRPSQTLIKQVIERGFVEEASAKRTSPRRASDLRIEIADSPSLAELKARAPRQADLLVQLVDSAGSGASSIVMLSQVVDRPPDARALIARLAKKGFLRVERVEKTSDPFSAIGPLTDTKHHLSADQQRALTLLLREYGRGDYAGFLLHGVTGSGKTEVYLRLIAHVLADQRTALVLVPEIALTPQLAGRFRARFGDAVAVLHSGLSEKERYDQWCRIHRGDARIVVGARSAIFAPIANLGAVIVDEEHDSSFKQEEGIRYHARDLALLRAKRNNAIAVLGSATPAFESYAGARFGRLELLEMPTRATPRALPSVEVIDLRRYRVDAEDMLSAPLAQAIESALERGEQSILFLNRRGFASFMICSDCGEVLRCGHCSVSLTLHQNHRLVCHYCGYSQREPSQCQACGTQKITRLSFGTQRIEETVQERFKEARVARLDSDTAAGKGLSRILERMRKREIDILVGTQMVTKGHDFPMVTVVGVLCADLGLHFPDFRAAERTFQLMVQVSGRAGRGAASGRVIIQTYTPDHPSVISAQNHDYRSFFETEIKGRQDAGYPPFRYLVAIVLDGERAELVERAAQNVLETLGPSSADVQILGPTEAPIARLRGRTRWRLLIKGAKRSDIRLRIERLIQRSMGLASGVKLVIDVDPHYML